MAYFDAPFVLLLLVVLLWTVCADADESREAETDTPSEMKMEVIKKPKFCLRKLKKGDLMMLKIEGKLYDTGEVFDSNLKKQYPYVFQHQGGQLSDDLETGVTDMCVGEKRKVVVPGGGNRTAFTTSSGMEVSPNSTLEYYIELQDIQDSPDHVMVFKMLNTDRTGKLSPTQIMAVAAQGLDMFPMVADIDEMELIITESFRFGDKDGDGLLDLAEYLDSSFVNKDKAEVDELIQAKLAEFREKKIKDKKDEKEKMGEGGDAPDKQEL